jgi:hypothetical protein
MSEDEKKGLPEAPPEAETQPDENEDKPEKDRAEPLAGFWVKLEEDGTISRRVFGTKQNVATMYGLVEVMKTEITAMASAMPGQTPNRETRLLSNLVTSVTNMANVLVGLQAGLNQLAQIVEEASDDKSEPELKDSSGETVPTEGSEE